MKLSELTVGEYYAARMQWPASEGLLRVRLLDKSPNPLASWVEIERPGNPQSVHSVRTDQLLHPWAEEQVRRKQHQALREQCRQLREACQRQGMDLDIKTARRHGSDPPQVVCTVQPQDMGLFSALLQGLGADGDDDRQPHHELLGN